MQDFDKKPNHFPFGDHFITSYSLFFWWCINTVGRKNGGFEWTSNSNATATSRYAKTYAAATARKPTAVTQLSNDDDAAATAASKALMVLLEKIINK